MPLYEYSCADHGRFDGFASLALRDLPVSCPACGVLSKRVLSLPRLRTLSPLMRNASERNERSRHEPRIGGPVPCKGHSHSPGGGGKKLADGKTRHAYKGSRPWVIEHQ